MKTFYNKNIKYLNESLLLSSYIFNENSDNDNMLYFDMDELNISQNNLKEKYSSLESFFIKTREKSRKIAKNFSDLSDVFKIDKINGFPNIVYFIMYSKLEDTIKSYTKEEFLKLYNEEFEDNLKTLGDIEEISDLIKTVDSTKSFNNTQKFTLLKMLQNTNGYFDRFYNFISEIEQTIKDNIFIIEELINETIHEINFNYIKSLKEYTTIEKIVENYTIDEIEISLRLNFYEKIGFSVYENSNNFYGEVYCGIIPFLLKDNFKNENDEKNYIFNILMTISDETRFNIIHLLNNKKMYGREIADSLELTTGTVSHHLTKLISVNIINSEVEGNRIYYTLNQTMINNLSDYFKNILGGNSEK